MQQKTYEIILRSAIVGLLVLLLLAIRAFEDRLFYDPFLAYFRDDYLSGPLPGYDGPRLFFGLTLRYFLNTILSLGIIYVIFRDFNLLKFTSVLYGVFFLMLVIGFFALLNFDSDNRFLIFYTRRFLIQPLLLLLFVPAFFYQMRVGKK